MKDITLNTINIALLELDEKYAEVYPKFKEIEIRYTQKYDDFLMKSQNEFTNQPSREAATRKLISLEPEYEEYNTLMTEVRIIETRMRNLNQISRNLVSLNWYDSGGGGEHGR